MNGLLHPAGDTVAAKLLGHVHRLARRDIASATTLAAVRKMTNMKQNLLLLLAFKVLPPHEWRQFRLKFDTIRNRSVKVLRVDLKLPFASSATTRRAYTDVLRTTL